MRPPNGGIQLARYVNTDRGCIGMGGCCVDRVYSKRSSVRRIRISAGRLGLQLDRLYRDRLRRELHVFREHYWRNIEFEHFAKSGARQPAAARRILFCLHIGGRI